MKNQQLSPEEIEIQKLVAAKQAKLASIVGAAEAQRLMDRAIKMVLAGQKSIMDII